MCSFIFVLVLFGEKFSREIVLIHPGSTIRTKSGLFAVINLLRANMVYGLAIPLTFPQNILHKEVLGLQDLDILLFFPFELSFFGFLLEPHKLQSIIYWTVMTLLTFINLIIHIFQIFFPEFSHFCIFNQCLCVWYYFINMSVIHNFINMEYIWFNPFLSFKLALSVLVSIWTSLLLQFPKECPIQVQ